MRCLAQKGPENNPGRIAIREKQLNMMSNPTAIKGCSTNNRIDEILTEWLFDQISKAASINLSSAEEVEAICLYYADSHGTPYREIAQIFHDEYMKSVNPYFRPIPVNTRVRELLLAYGINPAKLSKYAKQEGTELTKTSSKTKSTIDEKKHTPKIKSIEPASTDIERQVTQSIKSIKKENIALQIDEIRKNLVIATKDETQAYALMASVVPSLYQRDLDGVEDFLLTHIDPAEYSDELANSLSLTSKIVGAREYSKDSDLKFINLASCYQVIAEAADKPVIPHLFYK